ncbi:DUF547 domain-containing protein [Hoeflea prorocentri]|uniref:DUF547 domain-containing protein n=1 Tax=Hoeflea prorocentri TaxID=1922333 RepID=A0A9X3ULD6_9HYPH|nr:DUF547 domain-containing protein [Hoeflea prorocentri]MCY6382706.1 DUF547 domain-containing protein [Hoeflea prorocentri]MDA5400506.1 DUF547 domain-containing protein [Hoeflea prorocentri]
MTDLSRRSFLIAGTTLAVAHATGVQSAQAARPITKLRPRGGAGFDHSAFDAMLRAYVKPDAQGYNRFDYRGLKSSAQGQLKAYLVAMQSARPTTFSADEAHAYWINLYNAATLDVVADYYPVKSIKDIKLGGGGLFGSGPWSKKLMTVEGQELSLDDVEHRIVRGLFEDPMSHYGLNCASYSCPNLAVRAFTGSNLNSLLAQNAREYVNHSRGVSVKSGRITSSKIYSWYADDFGGRGQLKGHWSAFAEPQHKANINSARLGRFVYDWSLNDIS